MRVAFVRWAFPLPVVAGLLALAMAVPQARWAHAASTVLAVLVLLGAERSRPQSRLQAAIVIGKLACGLLVLGLLLVSVRTGPDQAFALLLSAKWPVLLVLAVLIAFAFRAGSLPLSKPDDLGVLIKRLGLLLALAVLIAVLGWLRQDSYAETALALLLVLVLVGMVPDRRAPIPIYGAVTDQNLLMGLILASVLASEGNVTSLQDAVSLAVGFVLTVLLVRFWTPKTD